MKTMKSFPVIILLVIAPLLWAGNLVVGRVMQDVIPPFSLSFFRWVLVVLILLPFNYSGLISKWPEIKSNIGKITLLSIFSTGIFTSFTYLGLHATTVLSASLINATVPVLIVFLSFIILNDSMSFSKIFAVILSVLGVAFIITEGDLSAITRIDFKFGDFFILIAALSWSMFSVFSKKMDLKFPPFLFLLITSIIGAIILIPLVLIEYLLGYEIQYNWVSFSGILYASLLSSIVAFTFWNIGVREVGPGIAGYFFNLVPVFGSIIAILFLGEKIDLYHLYGCLFVFLGIFFATLKQIKRQVKSSAFEVKN